MENAPIDINSSALMEVLLIFRRVLLNKRFVPNLLLNTIEINLFAATKTVNFFANSDTFDVYKHSKLCYYKG